MKRPAPRVIVFAGPNGAGKTTHAEDILEALGIATFVNADYIARGLSAQSTDAVSFYAGRIMLHRLHQLAAAFEDFSFESTLSSRSFAPFLRGPEGQGLPCRHLLLLPLLGIARRAPRAPARETRGHDVPEEDVRRRFGRSLDNFRNLYTPIADEWHLFDNSGRGRGRPIASHDGRVLSVKDRMRWQRLQAMLDPR